MLQFRKVQGALIGDKGRTLQVEMECNTVTTKCFGGSLFKKRLARTGSGKSGGYRTIVGYKKPNSERIIFLYAFAKSDKANISGREEAALSLAAESFLSVNDRQVDELLTSGLTNYY